MNEQPISAKELTRRLADVSTRWTLLALDKRRRGVPDERVVFVGIADLADARWCRMRSYLTNQQMEQAIFHMRQVAERANVPEEEAQALIEEAIAAVRAPIIA